MNQSLSDLRNLASAPLYTCPKTTISRGKKHADLVRDPVPPAPLAVAVAGSAGLGTTCEITGHLSKRDGRFALQTTARKLLEGASHPRSAKGYRIAHCQRSRIKDGLVSILVGPKGKAKLGGLQSCGSVWCCAVCSHKIMRLREEEVAKGMNNHFAAGGGAVMVTFTIPHKRNHPLAMLVQKFSAARALMRESRAFKTLDSLYGVDGNIRALEVTFGFKNGWHNHTHEVWLLEKHLKLAQLKALKKEVFRLWKAACLKVGLQAPTLAYGVDVKAAYSPAEYLTKFSRDQKWGTGAELAKSSLKTAKQNEGRFVPFDFLRAHQAGDRPEIMKKLFQEYAFAMFNGRQLRWSKGLKKRLQIEEKTDEELAAESEAQHIEAGTISRDDWRKVIERPTDARPVVLRTFEAGGMDAVNRFIAGLDPYDSQRARGGGRIWTNLLTGEIIGGDHDKD